MKPLNGIVKDAHDAGLLFGIPGFVLCILANLVLYLGSNGVHENGLPVYWAWAHFWNNVLYPLGFTWMIIGWGVSLSIIPAWWMHCQTSDVTQEAEK